MFAMKELKFLIASKIELIEVIEQSCDFFMKKMCNINEDHAYWFMVGFHEILINAYFHGNKKNENLFIKIHLSYRSGELKARVSDRGEGFNEADIPDPTKPENLLKPSGRGILFARKSCDKVSFKKEKEWFTVEIIKKVKEV